MQGTQVWYLFWEDFTCWGAPGPLCHHYWEAHAPRTHAPQEATAMRSSHRARSEVNIPRGAILSGFSPSGCAPVPLGQKHHRSETQLSRSGDSTPLIRKQTPPLTGQWQPQRKDEAPLNIQTGSGHNNNNQLPIKGIRAQVSGPPHPPEGRHQSKRN